MNYSHNFLPSTEQSLLGGQASTNHSKWPDIRWPIIWLQSRHDLAGEKQLYTDGEHYWITTTLVGALLDIVLVV